MGIAVAAGIVVRVDELEDAAARLHNDVIRAVDTVWQLNARGPIVSVTDGELAQMHERTEKLDRVIAGRIGAQPGGVGPVAVIGDSNPPVLDAQWSVSFAAEVTGPVTCADATTRWRLGIGITSKKFAASRDVVRLNAVLEYPLRCRPP